MLSSRLQTIFGAQFDDIEEEHLIGLIENEFPESDFLDFKQAQYDNGPKGTFEISKDVASFANEIGGVIVIGMKEDRGVASELNPLKISSEVDARMMQALAIKTFPAVRDVTIRRIRSKKLVDHYYLLVEIPRSSAAPHGVLIEPADQNPLCWPSRTGATTRFLREGELASRYRDRFALARGQVDRLSHIHAEGIRHPEAISLRALALDLALAPEVSARHPEHHTVRALLDYLDGADLGYANFGIEKSTARFQTKRRRVRVTTAGPRWELYTDGSAWIRVFTGAPSVGNVPIVSVNIRELENLLLSMLESVARFSLWAGGVGDCAVSLRVVGNPGNRLRLTDGDGGRILGEPANSQVDPVELTWSLADLGTKAGIHRAAYLLASDLEQDLGLDAPLFPGEC